MIENFLSLSLGDRLIQSFMRHLYDPFCMHACSRELLQRLNCFDLSFSKKFQRPAARSASARRPPNVAEERSRKVGHGIQEGEGKEAKEGEEAKEGLKEKKISLSFFFLYLFC